MNEYNSNSNHKEKSQVKEGVYRIGDSFYELELDVYPQGVREDIKDDFCSAEAVLNSINGINVPEVSLNDKNGNDVFIVEDMAVGSVESTFSFYEAASLHLLTSKTDVKGNIVEGEEGYAPIDFEAFLRSPLTEKASYYRHGRKMETNVELYNHSLAEIEEEADRHDIEFKPEKMKEAAKRVAEVLEGLDQELRDLGYYDRADNLQNNIDLILDDCNNVSIFE